ncbi:MAG: hypothetical protein RQ875_08150 [Vicingaceae bacterium]|nr:hypothetical protein [Vicingaceae bacterium]
MTTKERIKDIREKIVRGLEKTYEKLIIEKIKNDSVLIISENGEIVKIKPRKNKV